MEWSELLDRFAKHPSSYLRNVDFNSATAFLCGYDMGMKGAFLIGFREWLIVRVGTGNNLAWTELMLRLIYLGERSPRERLAEATDHAELIKKMVELVQEFLRDRAAPEGMRKIYLKYDRWLRCQTWYVPKTPSRIPEDF